MPTKNQTKQSESTKTVTKRMTKKTKQVDESLNVAPVEALNVAPVEALNVVPVESPNVVPVESVNATNHQSQDTTSKSIRKAGRTLLIKSSPGSTINSSQFDSLEGLTNKAETKSSGSFFLTFDNVTNAVSAFSKLRAEASTYRVKFSYYRIFFTMDGLTDLTDYNQIKKELCAHVENQTGSNVLYCKFYCKDKKYLGCGDFTIDTLSGMNKLLAKENNNKEYSFGSYKGTFYRYNGKKDKTNNQSITTN
jgi:hypothetical protein